MRKERRGFTLVELLVVIAIVAVLSAISFGVLASAKRSARRVSCLSNERQLGTAMILYTGDHDDTFPLGAPYQAGVGWALGCLPYLKSHEVFRCGADETVAEGASATRFVNSYGLNANLGGVQAPTNKPRLQSVHPATSTSITSSSKTVMFFEVSENVTFFGWSSRDSARPPDVDTSSPSGNMTSRPGLSGEASLSSFPSGNGGQREYGERGRVTLYATGDVGGRRLNGTLGSEPRHGPVAVYLACDGHAVAVRPVRVSGGGNAVLEGCLQGGAAQQPAGCVGQGAERAAGSAVSAFDLTLSIR